MELLQSIANPLYAQILGQKNIGALLAQIIKGQDITLPDLDRLDGDETPEEIIQQLIQAQAGVAQATDPNQMNGQSQAGGSQPNAQGLNPDGSPAGVNNG